MDCACLRKSAVIVHADFFRISDTDSDLRVRRRVLRTERAQRSVRASGNGVLRFSRLACRRRLRSARRKDAAVGGDRVRVCRVHAARAPAYSRALEHRGGSGSQRTHSRLQRNDRHRKPPARPQPPSAGTDRGERSACGYTAEASGIRAASGSVQRTGKRRKHRLLRTGRGSVPICRRGLPRGAAVQRWHIPGYNSRDRAGACAAGICRCAASDSKIHSKEGSPCRFRA